MTPTETANKLDRMLDRALAPGAPAVQSGDLGEVMSLVRTAMAVKQALDPSPPDPTFAANAEKRLMNVLRSRQKSARPKADRSRRSLGWLRLAPAVVSAVLVAALALGSVGVAAASASALPGDGALYQVKRGIERARLALAFSHATELGLLAENADARLEEIETLTELGRDDDLSQAVLEYVDAIDQLSSGILSEDGEEPGFQGELQAQLSHHIQVLQSVHDKVPAQAQSAIQRAIERSSAEADKPGNRNGPPGLQGEPPPGHQPDDAEQGQSRREQVEQEQMQRRAEQIARKYQVSVAEVLELFNGACAGDWKCVRDTYQQRGPG